MRALVSLRVPSQDTPTLPRLLPLEPVRAKDRNQIQMAIGLPGTESQHGTMLPPKEGQHKDTKQHHPPDPVAN